MQEPDDIALVRQYTEAHSEEAFATLVARYINQVYSVALRHTRNPHQAEEITQAVFVILAKKAHRFGQGVILSGWLYQTARLTSVTFLRSEIRRARREQEAHMQSILEQPAVDETWIQIAPLLDAAMARLNETDRHAVVLRFFDGKSMREVGAVLGANEDAAKKRVNRALEKLQRFFARRGVTSTTATIAGAMSSNSIQIAPGALLETVTAVAIAKGATASSSTLTLIKGALKVMAWSKTKTAVVAGVIILLAVGTTTVTVHYIPKTHKKFNPDDFWATTYSMGAPDQMQYITNSYGHPLNYTFPASPVIGCSIQGLLDQCMEVSGWHYLVDKEVALGGGIVKFGSPKVLNGEEWVAAFEDALQNGKPEWWARPCFSPGKSRIGSLS